MTIMVMPERRGVLFEMLRRQNIGAETEQRLGGKGLRNTDDELRDVLARTLKSWDIPVFEIGSHGDGGCSAPEPRGYNEFFRAVGA